MKSNRSVLLIASAVAVLFLIAGGLLVRVGAGENPYGQVVLFSEILGLVMDNYVDPVHAEQLLEGAYEGMLSGLDANGAYLTPEEVAAWKTEHPEGWVGPGFTVLKNRRTVQVVAVDEDSPAAEAGVRIGDHIREVNGQPVSDLSLAQSRRLLQGAPGSTVSLGLLRPADRFRRHDVEVIRAASKGAAYRLNVEQGIAHLKIHDLKRVVTDDLAGELDDVRSRGVEMLLIDLRNLAEHGSRAAAALTGVFQAGELLNLRNRQGELLETVSSQREAVGWPGEIAVLVNGATAGGAEAVARTLQAGREAVVFGETTFGLGAEPELLELEDGSGLLISAAIWETSSGASWNADGIEPDRVVRGRGSEFAAASADQLERVLELLRERDKVEAKAA